MSGGAGRPRWRQGFDVAERAAATVLERVIRDPRAARGLAVTNGLRRRARREFERRSAEWLHVWNIPAVSDLHVVLHRLADVDRRVAELQKVAEERAWR
jgi:hypothetical protein